MLRGVEIISINSKCWTDTDFKYVRKWAATAGSVLWYLDLTFPFTRMIFPPPCCQVVRYFTGERGGKKKTMHWSFILLPGGRGGRGRNLSVTSPPWFTFNMASSPLRTINTKTLLTQSGRILHSVWRLCPALLVDWPAGVTSPLSLLLYPASWCLCQAVLCQSPPPRPLSVHQSVW